MVRERLAALLIAAALAAHAGAEPVLPETRLPLRLIGTVVAAQAERSIAVIDHGGVTAVVRKGDAIGGAFVREILKDGVVLAQGERLERLAFAKLDTTATASAAPGGSSAVAQAIHERDSDGPTREASARSAAARRARAAARRLAAQANAVPASADKGDEAQTRTAMSNDQVVLQLASQARFAPLLDEGGKLRGVALTEVLPDTTLERLGLRSGDVVVSVVGIKVDNTPQVYEALRAINPSGGGEVVVERRGVPTRIVVPPGAL